MKLARLRRMGVVELTYRSRKEFSKWLERVDSAVGRNGRAHGARRALFSPTITAAVRARRREGRPCEPAEFLLDHFRETGPGRFFDGAVNAQTPRLLTSPARDEVLAAAEAAREGRIDLLGYRGLDFGDPIDWRLEPVSGRRAPLVHWSRLDPLDQAAVGDSKVVWELNRHQWLLPLAQAYRVSGDERCAEALTDRLRAWQRANPPGMGINWASSLEVALRLISWCWMLHLIAESKSLTPGFFVEMLCAIDAHASHVERYLSYYFSPNTHLTGEALGLFYAGSLFPQLRSAARWRALGARILEQEIERQVLPDGVYFEQATCYHRYTVDIYLHFLILATRQGMMIPPAVRERVQTMLDFLLTIRRPDGSLPQIGDADGGWLLPLTVRAPDDVRPIFSTAAAFFGRSDYAWAAGGPAPETTWLMGRAGLIAFEALRPTPPVRSPSELFGDGGYAVMRSGWDDDAHQLIMDVGPLGCPVSGAHGHADLLAIQCAGFGAPYLVDPGTYCYTADPAWRNFFRSTAAHSTVRIDGLDQADPAGPFAWKRRPRARLRHWMSTSTFDFVDADHDAYGDLPDPVAHRRRIIFVKPRYWVVVDDLEGEAEHRVELRFQCACREVRIDPPPWTRVGGPGGRGLLIRSFATAPIETTLRDGELAPIQGWHSPDYGQRRPAPVLIHTIATRLPLRVATVLFPARALSAPPPAFWPLIGDDRKLIGLICEDFRELVRFDARGAVVEPF